MKLSRISRQKLNTEQVDLTRLANSVCSEIAEEFPGKLYDIKISDQMVAFGDPSLLRICLNNLLQNAFKFSFHTSHPFIETGSFEKDGLQGFYVRDNGAGFDMTTSSKLFGVFQRFHTQEEFPGNGVGLTIVQRIIHRHGGLIWANSEIGKGATFFFTLPQMPDKS